MMTLHMQTKLAKNHLSKRGQRKKSFMPMRCLSSFTKFGKYEKGMFFDIKGKMHLETEVEVFNSLDSYLCYYVMGKELKYVEDGIVS